MRMAAVLMTLAVSVALTGCFGGGTASPKSDDDKTIYSIAYETGKKLQLFQLTDGEMKVFRKGLEDGLKDAKEEVDVRQQLVKVSDLIQKRSAQFAEKEKKESVGFLDGLAKEAGATKTESGLIFKEVSAGTGATPAATDKVKVHYHGTLRDGKVFDSSKERGQPATFPLNGVIPCWTEGVQKMKVGGKAILGCPAEIAYKDRGAPPVIKPGAALKFEVELIEIVKEETAAPATKKK
ncbi:MAG: FKBP-type peptidyl-prolyl cis-trans isomerase [Bdellovibrionaceae bacterium]|nr:FKBP-type peptidyl-prolyl cis-trans isomerase [Pseudobdellovibrionaceae bacterium]